MDELVDAYNNGPLKFRKCTMTIASPCVLSRPQHGLVAGDRITFSTTDTLPTGITGNNTDYWYFVITAGLTVDDFEISSTKSGSAINTSGSQTGSHFFATERTSRLAVSSDSCR
jgi:hypothetical protein